MAEAQENTEIEASVSNTNTIFSGLFSYWVLIFLIGY